MSEGWTAPKSGWYRWVGRIGPGNEPEYLGTERPDEVGLDQLMRVEADDYETRVYQNSGGNLSLPDQTIPNGTWTTLPGDTWTAISFGSDRQQ